MKILDDGTPYSDEYEDVYYARGQGVEESQYVFLQGNNLPAAWENAKNFTIAETGFGTGLNFFLAADLWQQTNPSGHLHFISFEKHPLNFADIEKIHGEKSHWIKTTYPDQMKPGTHQFEISATITLTLVIGDIRNTIKTIDQKIDVWFLDGFTPANNPDMWNDLLFQNMARLSHPGASFATFTAAGFVKRGLEQNGFTVQKSKGFGNKRDRLTGTFQSLPTQTTTLPWFQLPEHNPKYKRAIVIGGGLAGTSIAWALAQLDWKVTLIERHKTLATQASGNQVGILSPNLHAEHDAISFFYLHAFQYTRRHIEQFNIRHQMDGVVKLAVNEKLQSRFDGIIENLKLPPGMVEKLSQKQTEKLLGIPCQYPSLHFLNAGWVHPPDLCNAQVNHPNITVLTDTNALNIDRSGHEWAITSDESDSYTKPMNAETVIIASAMDSKHFDITNFLPLIPVRGQITYVPATPQSKKLKQVITYDGYATPAFEGHHTIGATFRKHINEIAPRDEEHQQNLNALREYMPGLYDIIQTTPVNGRAAIRATTPDHLPIVGPVPDLNFYERAYHDLYKGLPPDHYPRAAYMQGLYVLTGLGSHGVTSAPFCAQLLAQQIESRQQNDIPARIPTALHPARFLIRQLKKREMIEKLS